MVQWIEAPLLDGIGSLFPVDAADFYLNSLDCDLDDDGLRDSVGSLVQESSHQSYLEVLNANHREWPPFQVDTKSETDDGYTEDPFQVDTKSEADEGYTEDPSVSYLIRQPETRPMSQEQLVAEVKAIYAGLVMVESKCIEVDNAQSANKDPPQRPSIEQICAYLAQYESQASQNTILAHLGLVKRVAMHTTFPQTRQRGMKKSQQRGSDFSSGIKRYSVNGSAKGAGSANWTVIDALPDTGADKCFISPDLASRLGLHPAPGTETSITLPNRGVVQSPGMVEVQWMFDKERRKHEMACWILPGCIHDLVLGNPFLKATDTLTKFIHRIKSKLIDIPKRLRLRYLGQEKQRLCGYLNGYFTAALPDTGSDIMLIDSAYAHEIGLNIDHDIRSRVEVEFADGRTTWTSGIVRDVPWSVGGKTVYCDFHLLDDLCVDVILSNNYLFDMNIFSEYEEYFFDSDDEEDLLYLCNIRLIGQYSEELNVLEESYMEDMASPNAFNPETIQRELARRDLIRDKILALPESQRGAATQAESARQMHWEVLRQVHRARWVTNSSALPLPHTPQSNRKTRISRAIHKVREFFS